VSTQFSGPALGGLIMVSVAAASLVVPQAMAATMSEGRIAIPDDAAEVNILGRDYWLLGDVLVPRTAHGEKAATLGTRWPGGVVYYQYDSSVPVHVRPLFESAMRQWEEGTPLRFVPSASAEHRIHIVLASETSGCGQSNVGMVGGVQHLVVRDAPGCLLGGTVAHELGHAIGLSHEHQRSDRGSYITLIDHHGMEQNCPAEWTNFTTRNSEPLTAFDYASVMAYGYGGFRCAGRDRYVELIARRAQSDDPPFESSADCTSPEACTAALDRYDKPVSARDRWGVAVAYTPVPAAGWPRGGVVPVDFILGRDGSIFVFASGFEGGH
jgi:hypothetical protein